MSTEAAPLVIIAGAVGTVAGLLFGWLRDRDKLKYSTELAEFKAENVQLKELVAEQRSQIDAQGVQIGRLEAAIKKCEELHDERDSRLVEQAERLAAQAARLAVLEAILTGRPAPTPDELDAALAKYRKDQT